jgi:hypothetical protein
MYKQSAMNRAIALAEARAARDGLDGVDDPQFNLFLELQNK